MTAIGIGKTVMLKKIHKLLRTKRGFTLVETVTAISILTILTVTSLSLLVSGVVSWHRNINQGTLDTGVGLSMRRVAEAIRGSVSVVIDSNGQGITYYLPLKSDGHVVYPLQSDGTARRIYRSSDGKSLMMSPGGSRPLCQNLAAAGSTPLFSLLPSNKAVCITIATSNKVGDTTYTSTKSEIIRLRNLQ